MDKQQLYTALDSVNRQIDTNLQQLKLQVREDLTGAENLVQILQNLLLQRQNLLQPWLLLTSSEDGKQLQTQQQLTQDYARRMVAFRQYYGDSLVTRKRNERKLDVYKTLDAQR
ncbi:hypothetical protein [Shewanella sp. YIC-542]|uniref:hypothetical protein n=1 Tax=Shewanella mytili TaxID=3377111 RepID=UPI00398EDD19